MKFLSVSSVLRQVRLSWTRLAPTLESFIRFSLQSRSRSFILLRKSSHPDMSGEILIIERCDGWEVSNRWALSPLDPHFPLPLLTQMSHEEDDWYTEDDTHAQTGWNKMQDEFVNVGYPLDL